MMSHQAGDAITSPDPAQKAGTIERMKPSVGHSRSIPNVVQPGRRYQSTIGQTKSLSNMLRPVTNALHMPPPSRQVGQAPLCESRESAVVITAPSLRETSRRTAHDARHARLETRLERLV